jgi:hypothetical protein
MPEGYWIASEQFLKGIGKLLGNAHNKYSLSANRRESRIYSAAIGKSIAISIHFLCSPALLCIFITNQRKFLLTPNGSSPNYFQSHHTTFRQTQAGATVPLRTSKTR